MIPQILRSDSETLIPLSFVLKTFCTLTVIQFNIFLNDWFLLIKKASLHNYADDYYLLVFSIDTVLLVKVLSEESKTAIDWSHSNDMIESLQTLQKMQFLRI